MDLTGPYTTIALTVTDRLAMTAAYDQFFRVASGLPAHQDQLRDTLTALSPGRAAVAGLVTLGGMTSFLYRPDVPPTDYVRQILHSSLQATHYPELRL